ncbi:unnamed protein product [Microthlaspi erraticum]|uniref:Uncharacterized protein n=1 Tax=Microthlaspi erraticum TaxID=1685480 RepID=A0A6D2LGF6_9BRAS|nr:unnamed protein product [Microthlaspi erraticum]
MGSWIFKLLLPTLVLVLLIHHAGSSSIIRYLPGFEGLLPFELEAGYLGVGEAEQDQMFYYFIKSENKPEEDPLLLWLTGGPGCSSFSGLAYENGPITFKVEAYNGTIPSLVSTTYSWTKVANIIYLDAPVGAGFSYTKNPCTGNSYSGKVVPAIVQEISNGNCICCKPQINLQGYVLGNPLTDLDFDRNARIPFAHGMALISDELYESLTRSCGGNYFNADPLNTECVKEVEEFKKCISRIYPAFIPLSECDETSPDCYTNRFLLSEYWANNETVRRALKVVEGTREKWQRCDEDLLYNRDIKTTIPYHMNNSIKGIPSLIFCGDQDMQIPFISPRAWIKSLNYSVTEKWRPWMIQDKVAGYTTTYANKMTFATVKGGGHTLGYKPDDSSILFKRWISGQPL